jgi:hypothetical protein
MSLPMSHPLDAETALIAEWRKGAAAAREIARQT